MTPDINNKVLKDFGESAPIALVLIQNFEFKNKLGPRISRCVVHLAKGGISELKKSITAAETDWRDVILWAESFDFEFNKPFNQ